MFEAERARKLQAIESVFRNAVRKAKVDVRGTARAKFPKGSESVNVYIPIHHLNRIFSLVFVVKADNSIMAANTIDIVALPSNMFDRKVEDVIAKAIEKAVA